MINVVRRLAPAVFLVLALAAPAVTVAADRSVDMVDNAFQPATVEINVGDSVTWVNRGVAPHDATGQGWNTPLLTAGGTAAVTFTAAGSYSYICSIHPEMTGTVVVRAASAGGSGGGGGSPALPGTDTAVSASSGDGSISLAAVGVGLLALAVVLAAISRAERRRGN